jgi:MtaA/CmuA family methyltransferase
MNGNERLEAALDTGDSLLLMPITMMAAADHIGVPYLKYATDARVLAQAQCSIATAYDFDHVSVISDPAVEAADCGAKVAYHPDQPPAIDELAAVLADKSVLADLTSPDPGSSERMGNRIDGVRRLAEQVGDERVVEGWVEGPCAEAADLRGINRLMMDFFDDPAFVRDLFEFVIDLEIRFAIEQVAAGARIIGIGDAAASLVGPSIYSSFVYEFEKRLVDAVHAAGAVSRLHICGNITDSLAAIGTLGCGMIDLDSMVSVAEARAKTTETQLLLGNIDPVRVLRNGTPADVLRELAACRQQAGAYYVVGAGCEVPRDTPRENIAALRQFARGT